MNSAQVKELSDSSQKRTVSNDGRFYGWSGDLEIWTNREIFQETPISRGCVN